MSAAHPIKWAAAWGSPYTQPPNGEPRVRLEMITDGSIHETPPQILEAAPVGSGYAVWCTPLETKPPRRMSQEGRAKLRRDNLRRRVERKAPLFAEAIITAELARQPAYFSGANYQPTSEAAQ